MKDLEHFAGKRLPYKEGDDYVSELLADCAERAITTTGKRNAGSVKAFWLRLSGVAAVFALAVMLVVNLMHNGEFDDYKDSATLAEVLASMSDEQVMDIVTYELDEIPEYSE